VLLQLLGMLLEETSEVSQRLLEAILERLLPPADKEHLATWR
jgi:hypothetical protein